MLGFIPLKNNIFLRFEAYKAFLITLSIEMEFKEKQERITLVTVEFNLPLLEILIPPNLLDQKININNEISMEFIYPSNNSDILTYSATLFYSYE